MVDFSGQRSQGFVGPEAVVSWLAVAVFNALHQAGLANLDIFIQVAAGDGEELDSLQQRIGRVLGFFKTRAVELHPGGIASVEESLLFCRSGHRYYPSKP